MAAWACCLVGEGVAGRGAKAPRNGAFGLMRSSAAERHVRPVLTQPQWNRTHKGVAGTLSTALDPTRRLYIQRALLLQDRTSAHGADDAALLRALRHAAAVDARAVHRTRARGRADASQRRGVICSAPAIDDAPLLAARCGHRFALLQLESVRDAMPVMELFASAVSGAWAMTVGREASRSGGWCWWQSARM